MVNRDRHDITFEILRKATAGKKKTELMREVANAAENLSEMAVNLQNSMMDFKL